MNKIRALIAVSAISVGTMGAVSAAEKLQGVAPQPGGGAPGLSAPAASYSPAKAELVYIPITPCRPGRADISSGAAVAFQITGGSCGLPAYAKAVSVSLSAVPTVTGFLTAYPTGALRPNAAALNYRAAVTNTAGTIVPLSSTGSMTVYASGTAKVYVDVTGYYVEQIEGLVSASGTVYSGSSAILSLVKNSAGNFTVTVDRDVTYCAPVVTPYVGAGIYASAYAFNGNKVQVYTWYLNSSGQPVYSDNSGYFYLAVHC